MEGLAMTNPSTVNINYWPIRALSGIWLLAPIWLRVERYDEMSVLTMKTPSTIASDPDNGVSSGVSDDFVGNCRRLVVSCHEDGPPTELDQRTSDQEYQTGTQPLKTVAGTPNISG